MGGCDSEASSLGDEPGSAGGAAQSANGGTGESAECVPPEGATREIELTVTTGNGESWFRSQVERRSTNVEVMSASRSETTLRVRETQDVFELRTPNALDLGLTAGQVVEIDAANHTVGFEGPESFHLVLRDDSGALLLAMHSSPAVQPEFERATGLSIDVTERCTYEGSSGCGRGTTTLLDVTIPGDESITLGSAESGVLVIDGQGFDVSVREATRIEGSGCWYNGTIDILLLAHR